jgi:hypothetical protein
MDRDETSFAYAAMLEPLRNAAFDTASIARAGVLSWGVRITGLHALRQVERAHRELRSIHISLRRSSMSRNWR